MNLLVTVGTTTFDSLVSAIDVCNLTAFNVIMVQHAFGQPSKKYESQEFISDIRRYYQMADLIVTHAGAGSVYPLLEMQKRLLIVPNLECSDPHQKEVARYVEAQNYGCACWDAASLGNCIEKALRGTYSPYQTTPFFKAPEIVDLIHQEYLS